VLAKPTPSELEILRVLWERGPATVREVCDALSENRAMGYTNVLKLMQIMAGKGLLARDERERAHVYSPAEPAEKTKSQLALDIVDRVFGGSASELMMHALSRRKTTKEELDELHRLLKEHERKLR
jgi:BlaI family penicillinase repressor